ncbi:cobalt-zinc-cadmium efflux system outer membrane protein [Paucimonas lemoignei]|uniref:Cobalt-zinc-cadmium efflux system outer membrane protein n=1 Tax=Paucimonas lemoignei TaxID=29443 RepID=A0A4R3HZX2_PAULE|nr:TolC family protein [Paucimonas lemoignei]TCS37921.1 cobalt-zinc-cadmium efflux system outer membrane protein [Paucimonas lemoignei]
MYRYLLPFSLVAFGLPLSAQTLPPTSSSIEAPQAHPNRIAEAAGPLTLQAALNMALRANSELSAARYELQAVEASVLQAGVLPNPALEVGVLDTRKETRETTVQLSQPIELGGKRAARVEAAERGRDAALAELNAKHADIRAAVITAFFNVLAAQERLSLAENSAELAKRATSVASRRVAAGKVSPVEETKARVAEASVRFELTQAKSELATARNRLAALWGSPTPRFERVEGRLDALPALPERMALSQRLAASPALARARLEVDRRQALAQVERSRRIPDITLNMGVQRSEELGRNQAIVGVSIPLPFFDRNQGNILEALRRTDKARDELAATETRLTNELAQAFEQLDVARQESSALQQEVLPGAQSAYDAATKGFEAGKFNFLEVLDAQRTLLQAKSQYLRALAEAHRAAAEVDRLVGTPYAPPSGAMTTREQQ